ncbi:MAG TPA: efflux RND transporter permease subunit [Rhizomicrobium sp.]|nr:efflux RND transporter permease subunit [Rhizomicrobium sp.]
MNPSKIFIERPVMTTLVMAAFIIFGVFGYLNLPVSDLPKMDFPTINVGANLPGADPETVASALAAPLENAFSTINGIDSMTSSSRQGMTNISIQFNLDRNIDAAAQDVQAAISGALRALPRNLPVPPTFRKVNPADQPIIFIAMWSDTMKPSQLDEYAETMLSRQLSTIDGVAQVEVGGAAKYAVRIQADPSALAARSIGFDVLQNAVATANVNQATGALNGNTQSQIIHTDGQLNSAQEFSRQIFAYRSGEPVRIGDVATVLDGLQVPNNRSWYKGKSAIVIDILRQPGSNTVETIQRVRDVLPQFQLSLPPSVHLEIAYDRSENIKASIDDVELTLVIAAALVVLVIFAFLRRISATLIPSLALPIAVIGTFAGMSIFGFNLDNLSLMALTLSVGFVVDDAIVMLENIVRHIEAGMKPYDAALKGASEIAFTILSMTTSLAAVFIPIVFMGGVVGRLLHEFAITIVIAIVCSGVISITLTPMLCARILRGEHGESHNAVYRASEAAFNWMLSTYDRSLTWALHHKKTIMCVFAGSIAASVVLFLVMPQDFLPSDDVGRINGQIQAANGTSFNQMERILIQARDIVEADPNVESVNSQMGGGNGSAGTNFAGLNLVVLKPMDQRQSCRGFNLIPCHLSADQVIAELRPKLNRITGANVFLSNPPPVRLGGRGGRSNYQYTLQGLDLDELAVASNRLMDEMRKNPAFVGINSDYDSVMPSVHVEIDRDRAAAFGVTVQQIENALGSAFSQSQVSQINMPSNQYQVILELLPKYQSSVTSLAQIYVTAGGAGTGVAAGTLVPLTAVTKIVNGTMPVSINHSGQIPAITVSFDMATGYALSDAVSGVREATAQANLPADISGSFQGTAAAFQQSTQNMGLLLFVAMLVVYIILGILYESFIHPFTILSGLPSAAMGALLTLFICRMPLTLYAFVGMIMLIGIVKKNAIMMIDFALNRQRTEGVPAEKAIYEAAIIRFRPIMMTTMAAMMGTMPIALGMGAGASSRRPLGLCVAGGLLLSQLLTLYITPVIYIYLDRLAQVRWLTRRKRYRPSPAPAE